MIIQPPTAPNQTNCNTSLFSLIHLRNKLGSVSAGITINISQRHNPALVTDDESAPLHFLKILLPFLFSFFMFCKYLKTEWLKDFFPLQQELFAARTVTRQNQGSCCCCPTVLDMRGEAQTWGFLNWHSPQVKSFILRLSRIKWKKKSVCLLGLRLGVLVHIRMNLPTRKKNPGGAEEPRPC